MIRLLALLFLFSTSVFAEAPRVYLTKSYSQYFMAGGLPKFKKCTFYDNSVTIATKTGRFGRWFYRTRSTIYGHYYLNTNLVLANYAPLNQTPGVCDGPSVEIKGVRASGNRFILKKAIDCTGKVYTRQGDAAARLLNVVQQYCPNP